MIEKTITIDGKEVRFRASASVPRLYRFKFGRDIIRDMNKLRDAYQAKGPDGEPAGFDVVDLEIFENVAYIMARHADPDVPASPDEWLEQFNMFSIYFVFPHLLELWALNMETQAESKKKLAEVAAN